MKSLVLFVILAGCALVGCSGGQANPPGLAIEGLVVTPLAVGTEAIVVAGAKGDELLPFQMTWTGAGILEVRHIRFDVRDILDVEGAVRGHSPVVVASLVDATTGTVVAGPEPISMADDGKGGVCQCGDFFLAGPLHFESGVPRTFAVQAERTLEVHPSQTLQDRIASGTRVRVVFGQDAFSGVIVGAHQKEVPIASQVLAGDLKVFYASEPTITPLDLPTAILADGTVVLARWSMTVSAASELGGLAKMRRMGFTLAHSSNGPVLADFEIVQEGQSTGTLVPIFSPPCSFSSAESVCSLDVDFTHGVGPLAFSEAQETAVFQLRAAASGVTSGNFVSAAITGGSRTTWTDLASDDITTALLPEFASIGSTLPPQTLTAP